jgi:phosphoenolpyruvate phosphomutase
VGGGTGPVSHDLLASIRTVTAGGRPFRIAGAHDALTARLAEEAGFDGIWAGSLEMCASHLTADNGGLPLGQVLERVAEMAAAVGCPVLVDAATGYADPGRTVDECERAGAAGIVLEDQVAPMTNSLRPHGLRLKDPEQFGKVLQKAVGARADEAFAVIARVESLVAGEPVATAVRRADAYAADGADAVVIHSRTGHGRDVREVLRRLGTDRPAGVIPTMYHAVTAGELAAAGASFVIYANQGVRAQIRAVRRVYAEILHSGSSTAAEPELSTVDEVLDLLPPAE